MPPANLLQFYTVVLLILLPSCGGKDNLIGKPQTIKLQYIAWACACANWASPDDVVKYDGNTAGLDSACVYIEPADSSLKLLDTLQYSADVITFTGQFYQNKGFPGGFVKEPGASDPARVFRYTGYKVIASHYKESVENRKK